MKSKHQMVWKWVLLATGSAALILTMPHFGAQADSKGDGERRKANERCGHFPEPRGKAVGIKTRCAGGSSSGVARADFNNDGYGDLAIGAPFENIGSHTNAGAVYVIYGSPSGLLAPASSGPTPVAQRWSQSSIGVPGSPEDDDNFGLALAAGDFNNDGISDLAIGAPGESARRGDGILIADVGSVTIIYGSLQGLTATAAALPAPSLITPFTFNWPATCQGDLLLEEACDPKGRYVVSSLDHARLGSSLAWGDFDGDGANDLAVGAPTADKAIITHNFFTGLRDIAYISDAGLVMVLYGKRATPQEGSGRTSVLFQANRDDGSHVDQYAEDYDEFGTSLSAGNFNGDNRNGNPLTDLVVGVPYEDIGTIAGGGMVHVYYGCSSKLASCTQQFLSQEDSFTPGAPEPSDLFGFSLATGDFDGDGKDELAVGIPFENIGNMVNAGAVEVFRGFSYGLSASLDAKIWTQSDLFGSNPSFYDGSPTEGGDEFGYSLAAADFNGDGKKDLAIGVPYEDVVTDRSGTVRNIADAGEVDVIYGSSSGLSKTAVRAPQMWHQDLINIEGTVEADDLYGLRLSAWNFGGSGTLADLAIAVPHEKVNGVSQCGAVAVMYSIPAAPGLSSIGDQLWYPGAANVPGSCQTNAKFGFSLY